MSQRRGKQSRRPRADSSFSFSRTAMRSWRGRAGQDFNLATGREHQSNGHEAMSSCFTRANQMRDVRLTGS